MVKEDIIIVVLSAMVILLTAGHRICPALAEQPSPQEQTYSPGVSATVPASYYSDQVYQPYEGPESDLFVDRYFIIHVEHEPPNWWWRMWQYLLLGWEWKEVREDQGNER